jgi:hypothetical protein
VGAFVGERTFAKCQRKREENERENNTKERMRENNTKERTRGRIIGRREREIGRRE